MVRGGIIPRVFIEKIAGRLRELNSMKPPAIYLMAAGLIAFIYLVWTWK